MGFSWMARGGTTTRCASRTRIRRSRGIRSGFAGRELVEAPMRCWVASEVDHARYSSTLGNEPCAYVESYAEVEAKARHPVINFFNPVICTNSEICLHRAYHYSLCCLLFHWERTLGQARVPVDSFFPRAKVVAGCDGDENLRIALLKTTIRPNH